MSQSSSSKPLRLVWVYPEPIIGKFNEAPRLEVTKELRKLNWIVDLIAIGPRGNRAIEGVDTLFFPTLDVYFLRHLVFHLYVIFYLLENWNQIDVVMFNQMSVPWLLPLRFLFIFFQKHPVFVLDTRTVSMEPIDRATGRQKTRIFFFKLMNNLANRFADGQTTITSRMAASLQVPEEKLWGVWSSGVSIEEFSTAVRKRHWPESTDPVTVIYIGSLHYGRNVLILCQAVSHAHRQGMNIELVLYGEGTEKEDIISYANTSNGCIKVYDPVPHQQVPEILAHAHIGTLPFPDEEKFRVSSPIKLFEYMGAGLPILATKIACHTDVLGDGAYVFWADGSSVDQLKDAVQRVWQARSSLPQLGEQAYVAAQSWTYGSSALRLSSALQHGLSLQCKSAHN